ncbi:MAG: putative exported protein, partial [Pseudomonadota bacterium]
MVHVPNILIRLALVALAWALPPSAWSQVRAAGQISFVTGQVSIQRGETSLIARVGMPLLVGDQITTAQGSHLHGLMSDRAFLSVRAESILRIEQYQVNPSSPGEQALQLSLQKGAARYITGDAAKAARDRFRLNTPIAAVGVRGTDLTVFSTAEVTRVSVAFGAVVIAPLDESCRSIALGPCEGPRALLLTAQDQFSAELRSRAPSAVLLPFSDAAPDKFSPPVPEEARKPASLAPTSPASSAAPVASVTALQAQPQVTPAPSVSLAVTPSAADLAPDVTTPPAQPSVAPESPVRPLASPSVSWGRWGVLNQTLSSDSSDATLALFLQGREAAMLLGPYGVARRTGDMPTEPPKGMVSFSLADQHATVMHRASGDAVGDARVESGSLLINFDTNAFLTKLSLNAGTYGLAQLNATGRIGFDGRFQSDSLVSEGTVAGLLAGKKAQEAGYV